MFSDFPQLVPQKVCLSCQGCCRFKDTRSVWRPKVAPEELEDNEHKNDLAWALGQDGHIKTVKVQEQNRCTFLNLGNGAPRAKPVAPRLPRLVRYGEILFDNFAILAGVIRRWATRGFALRRTSRRSKSSFAFIHGQSPWSFAKKANKCGVYTGRPFECRLYPFLLTRSPSEKNGRVTVSVHLSCLYVQQSRHSAEFEKHVDVLKAYLSGEERARFLENNPALVGNYSEYRDEIEELFTLESS